MLTRHWKFFFASSEPTRAECFADNDKKATITIGASVQFWEYIHTENGFVIVTKRVLWLHPTS